MIIVIICACIVGGMWWSTRNKIDELKGKVKWMEEMGFNLMEKKIVLLAKDLADNLSQQWKSEVRIDKRIELLAKDIMELQHKHASLCRDINYSEATGLSMVTDVYNKVFEIKKLTKNKHERKNK